MEINLSKVAAFLRENAFCFATVEDGLPKVRPFCTVMDFEGKLYVILCETMHPDQPDIRPVWKQITANPNIAICAWDSTRKWLRISGTLREDTRPEAKRKMLAENRIMDDFTTNEVDGFQRIFAIENMTIDLRGDCASCSASGGFCTHDNCKRQKSFFTP